MASPKFRMPSLAEIGTGFAKWWGILGIMYGIVTYFHNKNDKIENAVSQKQLIAVIAEFNEKLDIITCQLQEANNNLKITDENTAVINDNFVTIRDEFKNHIRNSKDIPGEQKLNDILNVVQGIQTDLKQLRLWPEPKIKIEKSNGKEKNE